MPPPKSYYHSITACSFCQAKGRDNIKENGKKMGRPTTNPKTNVARLRLSDAERQKLDECCRLTGMSISEVLKQGIDLVYEKAQKK